MMRKLAQASTSRRRFFGLVGAAPLAARKAVQEVGIGLDRTFNMGPPGSSLKDAIGMSGGYAPGASPDPSQNSLFSLQKAKEAVLRGALRSPVMRREIEAILYAGNRHVGYIDHDIAVTRSISMSAKIVYQRQRNVQRDIEHAVLEQDNWARMKRWSERIISAAGLKF